MLIDGHALAYRVYFGLPVESFTTKQGEPTNATFGFTRTLLDLMFGPNPPRYLAVSFDLSRTFRDELYPAYKGTRAAMPPELAQQIERIKEVVQVLNIPVLELEGYEADDILGTLAQQAKSHQVPVHIITGDRDLLQLVDENTTVEMPPGKWDKGIPLYRSAEDVIKKLGVRPEQVVDYKAIVGDTSDNIPGVPGVGEKTAVELLKKYETLDNIYAHLEEIDTRFRNKLAKGKESAYLSQTLARIVVDAPVQLDLPACESQLFHPRPVLDLFHILEFRTFSKRVQEFAAARPELADELTIPEPAQPIPAEDEQPPEVAFEQRPTQVVLVQTPAELQKLVEKLAHCREFAFDLETTGLEALTHEIVAFCLAISPPEAYYIPVGHLAEKGQAEAGQMNLFAGERRLAAGQLPLKEVLEALRPAFTNPKIGKIGHNAKFDYAFLHQLGVDVAPIVLDTMIAEWLTSPDSKHKGLKDLVRHRLRLEMTDIDELIGKGKKQINFSELPIAQASEYGARDADMTLRLAEPLRTEVRYYQMEKLLDLEMPLIPVLADMEAEGIAIDPVYFAELSQELGGKLAELERKIYAIAGREFNLNSPQQLSDVLFKELLIPHEKIRKTATGFFSTASDVLESVLPMDTTGAIALIMDYRELSKLKNTYVDALPEMINPRTGRIHTDFNQTGAITGRVASNNPNLQNIPIRTAEGQKIRRGFVSRPGWQFISADYSQVELRILAHMCQDPALIDAFWKGRDIHQTTAASVFNIPLEEVTSAQRRFAKAVNFGLIYGMGAFRLSRDSELTLAESREFIETYFQRFPGIKKYLDGTKEQAKKLGYVETLFGRRRYFPLLKQAGATNANYQRAEREAINHPVQGTAADIIKQAMITLHRQLKEKYQARLLLQVHDELVLEAPDHEVEEVKKLVVETMSSAFMLSVPLKVEANIGRNWLELKE